MSDSEHSTVTYTSVPEDDSDIGSPGVEGPIFQDPPSPDYGPCCGTLSPDTCPGPEGAREAPPSLFTSICSGGLFTRGYIPESDHSMRKEPEEDDEEDPEEDPADYPADRGDDDDDAEEEEHLDLLTYSSLHMLEGSLDPRAGIRREMHTTCYETEMPRCVYRFVRGRVVLLLGLDARSGWSSAVCCTAVWTTTAKADLYGCDEYEIARPPRGGQQEVIELSTTVDQEDEIIYSHLDDARYDRALLRARVNRLDSDRPFHRRTALLIEEEARLSRAAWARSMDACDQVHSEGISLRTTVMAQQSEITELQAADRRRLARQQGPAKDPAEPELPEEASSST
ncbi:hypothetical protein Tco_0911548 [Tanacetum coccineum]|uniref:Uncharacterized protein n=1 Tax=Tanacetum coccineum TaxID=301880 RepID=A0ABQ5CZA5_9ASTR